MRFKHLSVSKLNFVQRNGAYSLEVNSTLPKKLYICFIEQGITMDLKKIEEGFKIMLEGLGEDVNREGLIDTPRRVAKAYSEMLSGIEADPKEIALTSFDESTDEMILVKNISFVSFCEHHFLPFIGTAHVAYLPGNKVVGLSKIPRIVDHFAKQPQVQERLTNQIAEFINSHLEADGVGVIIESEHSCMTMRGVKKPGASMVTSKLIGAFKENPKTRAEFLMLCK